MKQTERVRDFLLANVDPTALEITFGCRPWVSNPRARISDLRKEGHVITAVKRADGKTGFRLMQPGQGMLGLTG